MPDSPPFTPRLAREMGLAGLTATGVCSMVGAGINVIPFMIQRNVPGIGPLVLEAFAFAAIPAVLAAMAYAVLASAMPRAGGSYIYASRGLDPYLEFVASFSQWFALSIAIGVVAYVFVPFARISPWRLAGLEPRCCSTRDGCGWRCRSRCCGQPPASTSSASHSTRD